jgi:hypothetical protein
MTCIVHVTLIGEDVREINRHQATRAVFRALTAANYPDVDRNEVEALVQMTDVVERTNRILANPLLALGLTSVCSNREKAVRTANAIAAAFLPPGALKCETKFYIIVDDPEIVEQTVDALKECENENRVSFSNTNTAFVREMKLGVGDEDEDDKVIAAPQSEVRSTMCLVCFFTLVHREQPHPSKRRRRNCAF